MHPIYDKHFTSAELKKIIAYNNSVLGQKIIKVMPLIAQEGMKQGQEFGRSLGPIIQKRLTARFKKEGIK